VFTQCSKCETVFKLSADVLRAAGGQVRCGNCGEVFNALARLAEDANAFAVGGESSYELETRADSILRSPAAPNPSPEPESDEDFGPPGVEIARLQILDWNEPDATDGITEDLAPEDEEPVSDPSMEFTLPPGELDRIFVESKKKQAANATPEAVEFEVDIGPVPTQAKPLPAAPPPSAPPQPVPAPAPARAPAPAPAPARAPAPAPARVPAPARPKADLPPTDEPAPHPEALAASNSAFDVPDAVRFEILSGIESAQPLHELARPARTPGFKRWLTAAVLFALLLAVQMLHHNREYWVTHGPFAGALRALYAGAGAPVASSANLSAYQLRQWGVSGDPAADGTLRVRASILNSAAQLEPFPLLRVTLANRFGTSIGARDFEPSEYLGKPTARYLNPGEQVDATMDILDPGKSAEGFEIDVCLRGSDRKISCANDATPAQTKR
jgi:predicted Zn finger-like uncharacterized protein